MTTIFSYPYRDFSDHKGLITISTGPVVLNKTQDKILLHISSSTNKYQFIGGRLDDTLSPRENALIRAQEVLGDNLVFLSENEPLILLDTIIRDGKEEKILLMHYKASIQDDSLVGDAVWMTLSELETIELSSPNVLIASRFFLVHL